MNISAFTLPQLKQLRQRVSHEIEKRQHDRKHHLLKRLHRLAQDAGMELTDVLQTPVPAPLAATAAHGAEPRQAPSATNRRKGEKAPAKYRHPSNSSLTWSGRGRQPVWITAWLANGGTLDALAYAEERFARQYRALRSLGMTSN